MSSRRSSLPRLLLLVLPACATHAAFADGKFFRRLEVTDEPGIRAQRAVLAFKDGVETLIVQSDVDGSGPAYGWLLPLPAEPTAIEPCPANTLNALAGVVQPGAADLPWSFVVFSLILLLLTVATCLDHLRQKAPGAPRTSPAGMVVAVVFGLFLASLLLPSLSRGRSPSGGVEVLRTAKAGVYDVTVIQGPTAEAVRSWLMSNGFACPPSASASLRDYVADGWCFLAAKVSPEAHGTVTHHPLRVAFPAARAVYPLRLTGSDSAPIQLDLFAIGERRASASGMQTWVSDTYTRDRGYHTFDAFECELPAMFESGGNSWSRIAIPAVSALMWPGCVVTRLHARLGAADMQHDLTLAWLDSRPVRARLYSVGGAVGWSGGAAAIALAASVAWFTWVAVRSGWSLRMMIRRRLAHAIGLALLVGAVGYAMLEVVPTQDADRHAVQSMTSVWVHYAVLSRLAQEPPTAPFPEAYRKLLGEYGAGASLDGAAELDRPGDFRIDATENGWRLTIID